VTAGATPSGTKEDFAEVYRRHQAPISLIHDCGQKCAPINEGIPVCCDLEQAMPLVDPGEWELLQARTTMWSVYTPKTKYEKKEYGDGSDGCKAIVCRGVKHCERDNRSLACRSFPFFPYFNPDKTFFGLGYYWAFEGLCWVMSNLTIVEKPFIDEMIDAHEFLFSRDRDWHDTYVTFSASMRGAFTKKKRRIPVLGRDGKLYWVLPASGGTLVLAKPEEHAEHLPKFDGDKLPTAQPTA